MILNSSARITATARLTGLSVSSAAFSLHNDERIELKSWLSTVYKKMELAYPKFFKMDALCKAGILTAEMVMRELRLADDMPKEDWAVVLFNAASSLDDDRAYQHTIRSATDYFPSPAVFVYTLANIVAGEIAIKYKLRGETSFYIASQFNAATLCAAVSDVLTLTPARNVLAGWVEVDGEYCDVLLVAVSASAVETCPVLTPANLNRFYKI